MDAENTARCQYAINLANAGQKQAAYEQFCALYNSGHGNTGDVTLLYWLAFTTPSQEEAQHAIKTIARLEPNHPKLEELRDYVKRKYSPPVRQGPTLECSHCHYVGPVRVVRKIALGGWIWFSAFFMLFLCCMFALVPQYQVANIGRTGFFFLVVGIVGLFLIKKRVYVCNSCVIALGDIS